MVQSVGCCHGRAFESDVSSSRGISQQRRLLDRHGTDFFFDLNGVDHDDGVPRAAIEETAVRALAEAFLAADAENGIDRNAAKWRMVFVRHPEHTVFHWAIFHAGRRAGASGAAFGDDREFLGFLLARGGEAFGLRFKLLLVGHHPDGLGRSGCGRHVGDYTSRGYWLLAFGCWLGSRQVETSFRLRFSPRESTKGPHRTLLRRSAGLK